MSNNIGITLTADDKQLIAILRSIDGKLDQFSATAVRGMGRIGSATDLAARQFRAFDIQAGASIRAITSSLGGLAAVFASGFGVREFIQQADAMAALEGRLKNVTGAGADFNSAQKELYAIAIRNNVALADATTLFTRTLDPIRKMGGGVREASTVVDALSTALRINNASQAESSSAILQFSQAMASGVLRGEEFNSVNESAPQFLQALAGALGVGQGQLRKMAEEGKLTADVVGNAMPAALAELSSKAAGLPETVGGALADMRNEAALAAAAIDKATGATAGLADFIGQGSALMREFNRALAETSSQAALAGSGFDTVGLAIRGVGTVAEVILLLMSDVSYVLKGIGREAGGIAAQIAAVMRGDWTGAKAIGDAMKNDAAAARAELDAYQSRIAGMTTRVLNMRDAVNAGTLSMSEQNAEMRRLGRQGSDAWTQLRAAATGATDEQKKAAAAAAKAYADLMERIGAATSMMRAEAGATEQLTEVQRMQATIYAQIASGKLQLNALQKSAVGNALAEALAQEAANAAGADSIALRKSLAKIQGDANAAAAKSLDTLEAEVKAQEDYNAKVGLSKAALAQLEIARLDDALATAQQNLQAAIARGARDEELETITMTVEALRKLTAAKRAGVAKDAQLEEAEATRKAWDDITASVGQGLTDSLFRAFEAGRGFFSTLWDGIKNTIKSTVLKVLIQPIQQGTANFVGSMLSGLTGATGSGGGAGSALGSLGNLAGLAGMGSAFSAGTALTMSGAGGVAGASMFSGTALALEGAGAMMSSGSMMAGLGQAAGALGPYVAAAMALYAVYQGIKHKPTPHMGAAVGIGADGTGSTLYGDASRINDNFNAATGDALTGLGALSTSTLNALGQAFGKGAGYSAVLKFAADGKDASIGSFGLSQGGQQVNQFGITTDFNKYGSDREEAFKGYTADVAKATRSAIDQIGLPAWARKQFAALGSDATIEQINQTAEAVGALQKALGNVSQSFGALGGVFGRVSTLSADSVLQLAEFAGGLDNLRAQAQGFVENYYDRDEVAGIKAADIQRALAGVGLTGDLRTRDDFRAMVEGVDVGTEQGRQQLAVLLSAQSSFADIATYLGEAGGSLATLAATAPDLGALGSALSPPEQAQVDATYSVRDAINDLHDTIANQQTAMPSASTSRRWVTRNEIGVVEP